MTVIIINSYKNGKFANYKNKFDNPLLYINLIIVMTLCIYTEQIL